MPKGCYVKPPTIEELAEAIGHHPKTWEGRCAHVAHLLNVHFYNEEMKERYGLWLGPIIEGTCFSKRPYTSHGWLESGTGSLGTLIIDPTRWVFEGKEPYIFEGFDHDGYYDLGANKVNAMFRMPCPEYDPTDKRVIISCSRALELFMKDKLESPPGITDKHIFWLANIPLQEIPDKLRKEFYKFIAKVGSSCWVPTDNWQFVMEE